MAVIRKSLAQPDHRWFLSQDFALINVMQVPEEARADLPGPPLVPERHTMKSHLFPQLVQLRSLPRQQRVALLERAQAWQALEGRPYFSALLTCPDEVDVLRRYLIRRADVRLPDGGKDVLRLHDPRVFGDLVWILHQEQLVALMGNISSWSWCNAQGDWSRLVHTEARPAYRSRRFAIEPDQWPHLQHVPDIHAVLAKVDVARMVDADRLEWARRVSNRLIVVEQIFPQAAALDRRLFVEHAIRFGDALHRHPLMQERLRAVRSGRHGYLSAVADLDDVALAALARDAVDSNNAPSFKESP